jgi:hypothetical protein
LHAVPKAPHAKTAKVNTAGPINSSAGGAVFERSSRGVLTQIHEASVRFKRKGRLSASESDMPSPTFELLSFIEEVDANGGIGWALVGVTGTVELVFKIMADHAGAHLGDVITADLEQVLRRDILAEMRRSWWWLP